MRERRNQYKKVNKEIEEKVLLIRRLSKKTTGGNKISFSALVVVGNKKGKVGIGLGRGLEVPQAIRKGINFAHKHMITVPIYKDTIPHDVKVKFKGAFIILKPARQGVGLKVGSVMRAILRLAGISNASGKILRSRNQIANTYAVMKALMMMRPRI
ncbi:MAG TPA: 30S ribosomal protein S5 [Patescibacteria group bacterium]|nr:30S ribosomal protein S5 [Patescibacteria group bacterium]